MSLGTTGLLDNHGHHSLYLDHYSSHGTTAAATATIVANIANKDSSGGNVRVTTPPRQVKGFEFPPLWYPWYYCYYPYYWAPGNAAITGGGNGKGWAQACIGCIAMACWSRFPYWKSPQKPPPCWSPLTLNPIELGDSLSDLPVNGPLDDPKSPLAPEDFLKAS